MKSVIAKITALTLSSLMFSACMGNQEVEPTQMTATSDQKKVIIPTETVTGEVDMMIGTMSSIRGKAILPAGTDIPAGSYLLIKLLDVSKMDVAAELIAVTTVRNPTETSAYHLIYDLNHIDQRMTYSIQGNLYNADGKPLYLTKTSNPALTKEAPRTGIDLILEDISQ